MNILRFFKPKGVTICGCGPQQSPIPDGEVWYPNFRPPKFIAARLTRSFQMHPWSAMVNRERQWVRACPVPMYTVEDLRRYNPRALVYPLARRQQDLWTSSFDYMMALAIHEGFDRITLLGICLQNGSLRERLCEHVGIAYWVGRARGRGIDVTIQPQSNFILEHPYHYGFEYWDERRWAQEWALATKKIKQLDDGCARKEKTIRGVRFDGRG